MSDNAAAVGNNKENTTHHEAQSKKGSSQGSSNHTSGTVQAAESRGSSGPNLRPKAKSIGNYILGKTLGEGTFGKVKLAIHTLTGEKVAVKILEKDRIVDVSDVERVAREIHILKLIRHPHIIQLYEIIETPKQLFLVMEYANGGELFDYIVANTRVKEKEASRFFHEIISGIEYIHKLNIVHRDLKPENLLLDFNKSIKIVDFGLSNTYKNNETLKTACGSPCYAAPEMIAGKKYHGLTVDIWSCGVILFALICGYLPFEDPNTANLYKKILSGDYSIPKFVSPEGRDLIKNILNTDPTKRYTIDDIRKHPWMNQIKIPREPEGIIIGYHQVPIDHNILKQLEAFGINYDYGHKCLEANKHNHVTTGYYLLLKKFHQNGGKSNADINSSTFDKSLLAPKPRKPQTNNFVSGAITSNEQSREREKSREASSDKNSKTFIINYVTGKPRRPREKMKISGNIAGSSSREGDLSVVNYSSNGSRDTSKDNTRVIQPESREKSQEPRSILPIMKNPSNRDHKIVESSSKELVGQPPTYKINGRHRNSKLLNKSINNDVLKEKLNALDTSIGRNSTKPTRAVPLNSEHFTSPKYVVNVNRASRANNSTIANDILNESIKSDGKSHIGTGTGKIIDAIGNIGIANLNDPSQTNSDYNTKRADTSQRSTPKDKKVIYPHPPPRDSREASRDVETSLNTSFARETKGGQPSIKGNNPIQAWLNQPKQGSQSPVKNYGVMPREPVIVKPDTSNLGTAYRSKIHVGRFGRVRIGSNEPRAIRVTPSHSRERESARMGSMIDDRGRSYENNSQGTSANTSYILNSSYQHQPNQNNSFEYYIPSKPVVNNSVVKAYQSGGEGRSRRARQSIVNPISIYSTNPHHIINKRG